MTESQPKEQTITLTGNRRLQIDRELTKSFNSDTVFTIQAEYYAKEERNIGGDQPEVNHKFKILKILTIDER